MHFLDFVDIITEFIRANFVIFSIGICAAYFLVFIVSEIVSLIKKNDYGIRTIRYSLAFFIISYLVFMAMFGVFFFLNYVTNENFDFISLYATASDEIDFIKPYIIGALFFVFPIIMIIVFLKKFNFSHWIIRLAVGFVAGVFIWYLFEVFYDYIFVYVFFTIIYAVYLVISSLNAFFVTPFKYFYFEYKLLNVSNGILPNIIILLLIPFVCSIIWRAIVNYFNGFRYGRNVKDSGYYVYTKGFDQDYASSVKTNRATSTTTSTSVAPAIRTQEEDKGNTSIDDFLSSADFEDLE